MKKVWFTRTSGQRNKVNLLEWGNVAYLLHWRMFLGKVGSISLMFLIVIIPCDTLSSTFLLFVSKVFSGETIIVVLPSNDASLELPKHLLEAGVFTKCIEVSFV